MGGCACKGPVKVVPKPSGKNSVSAKLSRTFEVDNGNSLPELPGDLVSGANCGEKSVNSPHKDALHVGGGLICKENDSQVVKKNVQHKITCAAGNYSNDQLKEKRELPKLVKTTGYNADTALRKPLAFDIGFLEDQTTLQSKPRKYPRRLEKLKGAPRLTAELLQQKQEIAEKNRCKELQKKAETISKHHRELLQAREYEKSRNAEVKMNAKLLAMEKNRQSHVEGIIFKQKRREEKARCVQAKALCLNGNKENLVYVDETYNSDGSEDEVWKEGDIRSHKESEINTGTESKEDISSTDEFFAMGPQEQSSLNFVQYNSAT